MTAPRAVDPACGGRIALRPPAPVPKKKAHGTLGLLSALRENPILVWTQQYYEQRIVVTDSRFGPSVVVCDPEAIRRVLLDNVENYRKDALQKRLLCPALGNGLLTSDGDAWREQRRRFAPQFSLRMIAIHEPAMVYEAQSLVDRLRNAASGQALDITETVGESMLGLLERTLFLGGIGHKASEFMNAATKYFNTQGRVEIFDILRLPAWMPRLGAIRARPALKFFPKAVERVISARLKMLDQNPAAAPKDLVAALIEVNDGLTGQPMKAPEIAANIITFIGAGYETPSNALTWSLFLLSFDENWRRRVEDECDREMPYGEFIPGSVDRFHATRALIEEAMRLYPPVAIISREAVSEDVLAGHIIAPGTIVVIPPWVLHRHRSLWQAPDCFDPSRFMPNRRGTVDRYAYLPFGAGPRVCIGASFAMQSMIITVASISRHLRLDVASGQRVEPLHRITLRPRRGIKMIVSAR